MPALPPVPNTIKVRVNQANDSDVTAQSTLFFTYTGGPPSAVDCAALATAFRVAWAARMPAYLSTNGALLEVDVQDLASTSGKSGSDLTHVSGTRTGGEPSAQQTLVMNYGIGQRYRGGKPKSFTPFLTRTDMNDNRTWNSTNAAAAATQWAATITAFVGATSGTTVISGQVAVSYYSGKVANPNPNGRLKFVPVRRTTPVTYPVTKVTAGITFGSQRRRLRA